VILKKTKGTSMSWISERPRGNTSMMLGVFLVLLGPILLGDCSLFSPATAKSSETSGQMAQGPSYSYRPLDPLKARLDHAPGVPVTNCRILELLPDETVRLAVGQVDMSGNVSYGVAKAGAEGHSYVVVLDYIKSDTFSIQVTGHGEGTSKDQRIVPTYVGIGLRLSAHLLVNQGTVDLGNLVAIGAAAQEKRLSGTLVIQTLGISGESVAAVIPIPSEISAASIQNALVAIGTIKSKIYDEKTTLSPRVVGTYNVFGDDGKAFDAYFTGILATPPALSERANSSQCPASPESHGQSAGAH
jgi:hypothetical protein